LTSLETVRETTVLRPSFFLKKSKRLMIPVVHKYAMSATRAIRKNKHPTRTAYFKTTRKITMSATIAMILAKSKETPINEEQQDSSSGFPTFAGRKTSEHP